MNYEKAWNHVVEIAKTIKEDNYIDEIEAFILCIEYLQSELENEEVVVNL